MGTSSHLEQDRIGLATCKQGGATNPPGDPGAWLRGTSAPPYVVQKLNHHPGEV